MSIFIKKKSIYTFSILITRVVKRWIRFVRSGFAFKNFISAERTELKHTSVLSFHLVRSVCSVLMLVCSVLFGISLRRFRAVIKLINLPNEPNENYLFSFRHTEPKKINLFFSPNRTKLPPNEPNDNPGLNPSQNFITTDGASNMSKMSKESNFNQQQCS